MISPSSFRLGAQLTIFLGTLTIILPAKAQDGQVEINGRKASNVGLLARVKDGANPAKLQAAKGRLANAALKTKAEFRTRGLMLIGKNAPGAAAAMTSEELQLKAKQLMATGLYEYVEPDWIVTVNQVPTDTAYADGSLWGLRNTGQSGGAVGVDVNAQAAWAVTTGSPTVIVGVVDSGIRYTHQDLAGNMWVNPGEIAGNRIDDDANGFIDDIHGINAIADTGDPMDDNNHGTHCAGTIGATANNAGQIVGVAWNVKLMGLKFLSASGSGSTSDAIKCIDYGVAKGAHILSNSWGGGGSSQAMRDSIAAANRAGVLFVAAAGNSSSNNDEIPNFPSNYDVENVVAVAAVDRTGALARFSSYGATTVDVAAPGVSILSSIAASDTSYDTFSGTSMATPHVAGVAALIKSRFPTATIPEIKNRLIATTRPLSSLTGRTVSGGIVDSHAAMTVAADGVLELRVSSAQSPLRNGVNTAFYITVSDLTPVMGASVSGALGSATQVAFLDNGVLPDVSANDGTYSANLRVPSTGSSTTFNVRANNGGTPATAAFPFTIISPPGNDDFANRTLLASGTTQATGTNQLATFETGEPRNPSVAGTKSVWWEWAAGTTGNITITTSGSNFDTTLAVYSGSGPLASLVHLGSNDDSIGLASSVTFQATSGQRYYLQVNGFSSNEGNITLNYPSPANVNSPPVIMTQPMGAILVDGDPLDLSVTASGTAPLRYQWTLNGSNISGATSATYSVANVVEANEGNYAVTISNGFGSLTSASVFVGVDPISVRPGNDLFANAETLPGAAGRMSGTNQRASAEPGEPDHAAASAPVESVWYRWTAPAAGTLSLDTYGSSLDTNLAAYTGQAVNALTERAANTDAGGLQSFISVAVTAGEVLHIAIDGAASAESIFSLNYFFQPTVPGLANDAFANRVVVSGLGGTFASSNISATGEAGEPVHESSAPPTASVWWSWTAPANGVAVMDTLGSNFDTVLAVYTGSSVSSLTRVASDDNTNGPQSRVAFRCVAGTSYSIAVDGRGAAQGLISLSITSGATEPEIAVEHPVGNGLSDSGPTLSWGSLPPTENAIRSFTVRNTGGARLMGLRVQIEGTHAADFVLTQPPALFLNGGATTTFSIRFAPGDLGPRTAVLRLSNNDANENPFDIPFSGTGVPPAPEIVLEEPAGRELIDGSATTAFGTALVGNFTSKTYTVRNTGNAALSGLAVTFSGTNAADFSVTTPPAASVPVGGNTTFTVKFTPGRDGTRTAALELANNDSNENPFNISLSGRGYAVPTNLNFQILSLDTTNSAVVDHDSITGDDRGGIAVSHDRVFCTGDTATARYALDLTNGVSIGRVSNGLCSDIGSGVAYVLANNGVETTSGNTVNQLIELDPLTGALTRNVIPLSTSFTLNYVSGIFSGNGRVVVHNGTRVYDILVPSGVVTDMGEMRAPAWRNSESWAIWGVAEFFDGNLHLAYCSSEGSSIVRSRVPDGQMQTISTFRNLSDMASWTVSPITGRWYFHHEYSSQFGGMSETLGYADATFAMGPPTEPPVITSPLTSAAFSDQPFSYQIRASRSPQSYNASGLPAWLSVNTSTGLISGTPRALGTHTFSISATNEIGTTTETLTITVGAPFARVAIFTDPLHVNAAAIEQLQMALTGIGCPVTPFSGTSPEDWATAFASSQLVVIPRLDFSLNPNATTLQVINQNLAAGKGLIITGSFLHDESFLNLLRGWTLTSWTNYRDFTMRKRTGMPDFVNSPPTLLTRDNTYLTPLSSLESSIRPIYDFDSMACGAFVSGRVGSLSYDWISGPDVSWDIVLKDMIASVLSYVSAPEIQVTQSSELVDNSPTAQSFRLTGVGQSSSLVFTIKNGGFSNLTGVNITIDGPNATDFSVITAPETTLISRSTTTFVVRFTPSAIGTRTATIRIASNDADENPFDIALTGTGVFPEPEITVVDQWSADLADGVSTVSFGTTFADNPTLRTFTIRNTGTTPLTGLALNISGANAGDYSVATTPSATVAPGSATNFAIRFGPRASGTRTATIRIASNDADENPFDIALTGTGVFPEPEIVVEDRWGLDLRDGVSTVDFGQTFDSSPVYMEFTIRNAGSMPLTGIALNISGTNAEDFRIISAPSSTVASGSRTTFQISFAPRAAGIRTASIRIASNDADENPFDIALSGTGILSEPDIVVEQPSRTNLTDGVSTIDYGQTLIGAPISRTFVIRNTGRTPLTGISVSLGGSHAADWNLTTAPSTTVEVGSATTFIARFNPSTTGSLTATLQISSNDPDENPFDIVLTGTTPPTIGTASVFANASFVDTSTGGELDFTRQALTSIGYAATNFTGITAADWNAAFAANVVVIPELENSFISLTPDAIAAINHHLSEGKGLILMADNRANDNALLSSLRGWRLASGPNVFGSTLTKVAGVPGFANSPGSLAALNATFTVTTASLPAGTQAVYQNGTNTAVFLNGNVGFMAYDWNSGADRTWSSVLGDLIAAVTRVIEQPEIEVAQPLGTNLTDGDSTVDFGRVVGTIPSLTFVVRNSGTADLTGMALRIDGANATDFSVTTAPTSTVSPGSTTSFVVRFEPGALGNRSATLSILSNDANESPFEIALTGASITAAEGFDAWLPLNLSDRTAAGIPHADGVPNLLKYAFNLNPSAPDYRVMSQDGSSGLPVITLQETDSGPVLRFEFIRRIGSRLIYSPEKSSSLTEGNWTALTSLPMVTPVDEFWERLTYEEPVDPLSVPVCLGRVQIYLP